MKPLKKQRLHFQNGTLSLVVASCCLATGCQAQTAPVPVTSVAPLPALPPKIHATISTPSGPRQLHAPETQDTINTTPRVVAWVEPKPLNLPSNELLTTISVKGKSYNIKRVAPLPKKSEESAKSRAMIALYDQADQALYFRGSGRGGLESKERLIIEDCTFIIDFEEGDFERFEPRRAAIFVEGFKEVLVRNCIFISKATGKDPIRKVTGSFVAYDCVKVEVNDCYFEGRTAGWRGHLLAWGCGPTSIRNVEINGRNEAAGGIWIANGVGESKIGWPHQNEPELMIYPPGPLLVENAWVHDQKGTENSDGIYVQAIQPYLLRNCKVENWGPDDSLIDVGFRDTAPKQHAGKILINHGGLGMVENCEFSNGYVKDSVGMAGGMIFRNNLMRQAWFFPYVFDGGSWYVVGNRFEPLNTVIVSGRGGQTGGWTPQEGIFTNGSKMYLYNNIFVSGNQKPLTALYVGGAQPAALKDVIVADYNVYALATPPQAWGLGSKGEANNYNSFEAWRAATGNDKNSVLGAGSLDGFKNVPADTVKLPGGVPMQWGQTKVGLTGPVGVQNASVLARAKPLREAFAAEFAAKNGEKLSTRLQAEKE